MYSTETLLVETSHAQHERNIIQEFLTTRPSTIKPISYSANLRIHTCIFSYLVSHNLSYAIIKVYLCGVPGIYTSFPYKMLLQLHQVLKGICKDRVTISPHQVCHSIAIDVMKGIKKALSEQPHNLAFFTFLGSSEFTNPLNNWMQP